MCCIFFVRRNSSLSLYVCFLAKEKIVVDVENRMNSILICMSYESCEGVLLLMAVI